MLTAPLFYLLLFIKKLFAVRQHAVNHAVMIILDSLVDFGVIDFACFNKVLHGFVIGKGGAPSQPGTFDRGNGTGEFSGFFRIPAL